jgi:hypothetical protein
MGGGRKVGSVRDDGKKVKKDEGRCLGGGRKVKARTTEGR